MLNMAFLLLPVWNEQTKCWALEFWVIFIIALSLLFSFDCVNTMFLSFKFEKKERKQQKWLITNPTLKVETKAFMS